MGLFINISGLDSEESVTTFRLLVSEEALRSAEICDERAERKSAASAKEKYGKIH